MTKRAPAPWEAQAVSQAAAETAAGVVVERHDLSEYEGEAPLEALSWAMGERIDYGQALREFGYALIQTQNDPATE